VQLSQTDQSVTSNLLRGIPIWYSHPDPLVLAKGLDDRGPMASPQKPETHAEYAEHNCTNASCPQIVANPTVPKCSNCYTLQKNPATSGCNKLPWVPYSFYQWRLSCGGPGVL